MMQDMDSIQEELVRRNEQNRLFKQELVKISTENILRFLKKVYGERVSARTRLKMTSSHKAIGQVEFNELCMPWMKRKTYTNMCDYPVTITIGRKVRIIQSGETVEV